MTPNFVVKSSKLYGFLIKNVRKTPFSLFTSRAAAESYVGVGGGGGGRGGDVLLFRV